jgi:hypothetical protein
LASDRVIHGTSGFLYPTGQVDTLTKHMKIFIENKDEIKNLGLNQERLHAHILLIEL